MHHAGLDWQTDRRWARQVAAAALDGPKVLQGNLDPSVLYANPGIIREKTHQMIDELGVQRTIANLGHGFIPTSLPTTAVRLCKW